MTTSVIVDTIDRPSSNWSPTSSDVGGRAPTSPRGLADLRCLAVGKLIALLRGADGLSTAGPATRTDGRSPAGSVSGR